MEERLSLLPAVVSERHLPVDTPGLLLPVIVSAASVQDRDSARLIFKRLRGSCKKLRLKTLTHSFALSTHI